jgi:hypothetical protein
MMPLNLESANVLSGVLTGNAPNSAPDAPDFANMVVAAGKSEQSTLPVVADSEPNVPTLDFANISPELADEQATPRSPVAQSKVPDFESVSTMLDTNAVAASDIPTATAKMAEIDHAKAGTAPTLLPAEQPQSATPIPQNLIAALVMPVVSPVTVKIEASASPPEAEPVSVTPARLRLLNMARSNDKPTANIVEPMATPIVVSVVTSASEPQRPMSLQIEPVAPPPADIRMPAPAATQGIERALPTLVERMIAFKPTIIDAARDVAQVGDARDLRFNVRPETLGLVAVTIERTDAGQSLRLGVETPAAVQAVRQAEPTFTDARSGNSFVNVTVDMTASDQRGPVPRVATAMRQNPLDIPDDQSSAPALAGRYA